MVNLRDIPGFEGKYMASEDGRIFSIRSQKFMKFFDTRGYLRVGLQTCNGRKKFLVHRLVAMAFIPNPKKMKEINHKNANKRCNRSSNLEWCSRSENIHHAVRLGLWNPARGEAQHNSKLTEQEIIVIRRLLSQGQTQKSVAAQFNIAQATVWAIKHRRVWKHVYIE